MAKKRQTKAKQETVKKRSSSKSQETPFIKPTDFPELVFGLIGPAGTDLKLVFKLLRQELQRYGYRVPKEEIRLSKLIEEFTKKTIRSRHEDERINELMSLGTEVRATCERGDSVALLGLLAISRIRDQEFKGDHVRNAYVIHSLKRPEEVETFRAVYGRGFYAISVFSPREARVEALANRIGKSRPLETSGFREKAERLIERDELEEGTQLGQKVRDAFPLADLFIDTRNRNQLESNIKRFIELILGHPYHTPTKDEYGMFHAKAAALRSADLGRQVGAVISTKEGDIVAVGCNDVPKAGGGLYWTGDISDARDFQRGGDTSVEHREYLIAELLGRLNQHGWLAEKFKSDSGNQLAELLLLGKDKNLLKGTQLLNLLEFGRSVHAEMAALMDAARRGISVKTGTLYTTTFPCHLCAKHIIAAGIERVIYIEPYPKSKAKDFYSDSISADPIQHTQGLVSLESFVGIAPRQYLELFEMRDPNCRKTETGKVVDWSAHNIQPKIKRQMNTYLLLEKHIMANQIQTMKEMWDTKH